MHIYFVRHGESEGNFREIIQDSESPLSENGKKQVKSVAKRLKEISINCIYASPYARAKQTAEEVSSKLNLPIEYWDDLVEMKRTSKIEGLHHKDPQVIEAKRKIAENWLTGEWKLEDGESFIETYDRAHRVLDHLSKNHKDQKVICVSHGTFMKMIVCVAIFGKTLTPQMFWDFNHHAYSENTGITHLRYTQQHGWTLWGWNDVAHF